MTNRVVERFGREIVIKDVVVGKNLNVMVIRGFATLDQLAYISAPDVYNQLTNPLGTQRDPDQTHARQVLEYAITSLGEEPDTSLKTKLSSHQAILMKVLHSLVT